MAFSVNKPTTWMGYSLDGQENITVSGNVTLNGLSSGFHKIIVYANDTYGNNAASQSINFTVAVPPQFPVLVFVFVTVVLAVVIAAVGIAVFRWRRRVPKQQTKQLSQEIRTKKSVLSQGM